MMRCYCNFSLIIGVFYIIVAAVIAVVVLHVFIITGMVLYCVNKRKRKFDILLIINKHLNITHLDKPKTIEENLAVDSKVKSTHD